MNFFRTTAVALSIWTALWPSLAAATQNELVPPTAGIFTGVQFSQKIGDAFRSLASCNKGAVAPANVGGVAVDGLCWIDDSVTPWVVKRYVNGGWAVEAALDPSTSTSVGAVGGGIGSVNSASTTDLASVPQANVNILGTVTIAGFGSSAPTGAVKFLTFAATLVLTYSSALPTPCGVSLLTAANDRAVVTHLGSGNWAFFSYQRANGIPVDCAAVGKIEFGVPSLPGLHVLAWGQALTRTSYPAYLAAATRAQNGTRTSGNATIAIGNTSGYGVGMPVEGTGINAGCTIASWVADTSITLNSSACVTTSGTSTVTVFVTGYGSGGSSSTVGAPPCTGRAMAGREPTASLLTSSYFGSNSTSMMAAGGSESVTMAAVNIYQHLHAVFLNDPTHVHTNLNVGASGIATIGSTSASGTSYSSLASTSAASTGITVRDTTGGGGTANQTANAGSATPTPMRTVAPRLIADCFVRVTP